MKRWTIASVMVCLVAVCGLLGGVGCTTNHGSFGFEQSTKWGFYQTPIVKTDPVIEITLKDKLWELIFGFAGGDKEIPVDDAEPVASGPD